MSCTRARKVCHQLYRVNYRATNTSPKFVWNRGGVVDRVSCCTTTVMITDHQRTEPTPDSPRIALAKKRQNERDPTSKKGNRCRVSLPRKGFATRNDILVISSSDNVMMKGEKLMAVDASGFVALACMTGKPEKKEAKHMNVRDKDIRLVIGRVTKQSTSMTVSFCSFSPNQLGSQTCFLLTMERTQAGHCKDERRFRNRKGKGNCRSYTCHLHRRVS
jgi:hypothetical protein